MAVRAVLVVLATPHPAELVLPVLLVAQVFLLHLR
jgi:hypothetical protein